MINGFNIRTHDVTVNERTGSRIFNQMNTIFECSLDIRILTNATYEHFYYTKT